MRKIFVSIILIIIITISVFAQSEVLSNQEIILMTRAGLSKELIIRKIKETKGVYKTNAEDLIELKKAGVEDDVIKLLLDHNTNNDVEDVENYSDSTDTNFQIPDSTDTKIERIVLEPKEALQNAKTIAIKKSSLHPSRQALEKELLKRKDWKDLDLIIVRYKEDADLLIEIGYVSMSWITHRYVYRVYDNKSGTVIIAGETTSWGDLPENLARGISKRLYEAKFSK